MGTERELATWLVSCRREIERRMVETLGPAAPAAAEPEAEALRRFRSYAASALLRGDAAGEPALDGVRPNERRMGALLTAWVDAASAAAGAQGPALRSALRPLAEHFLRKLRTSGAGRRARGAPRTNRRAVAAAIDRVSDAFLAIDTETGKIADANPAAGALLGVKRDALLGVDAMSFVPTGEQDDWWSQLDAIAEGNDQRRFAAALQDVSGGAVAVAASVTRFATRDRTLALVLARPR